MASVSTPVEQRESLRDEGDSEKEREFGRVGATIAIRLV
jgi:hypothetical protein